MTPAQAQQELRSFRAFGSVLLVAAHPDDENTQLIAYLARGRGLRTGYLSLTRGDGGQNQLGAQFGEALGVARTQELLAARRIDGGQQFFTRARDFGFSKSHAEALQIWGREAVLGDVVRVIRRFRPDVIVTVFSPQPGLTHGHHTASAVLAVEAFGLAGDPRAYPEQLTELQPWQPKRIVHAAGRSPQSGSSLPLDIGGRDPITGEALGTLAARSLATHKTQGLTLNSRGGGATGPRIQYFQLLAGEVMRDDIMDGIDVTWSRVPGASFVDAAAAELITSFDTDNMAASVPSLLSLRKELIAFPAPANFGAVIEEKRRQLDRILQTCLGLSVSTTLPGAEVVAGEPLRLQHSVTLDSRFPASWTLTRYPATGRRFDGPGALRAGEPARQDRIVPLPADLPLSHPYWLKAPGTEGLFQVEPPGLIGTAQNVRVFPVEYVFDIEGQQLILMDEPVQANSAQRRALSVVPPATLRFPSSVELFNPGETRSVIVQVSAARDGIAGTVKLTPPPGWTVAPDVQTFRLPEVGEMGRFEFSVTAPRSIDAARLEAALQIGGRTFAADRVEIDYPHIPFQLMQPPASMQVVSASLTIRGQRIGYIPGAGDKVAEAIERMGYRVSMLDGQQITATDLRGFDAIVIGVRAFNVHPWVLEKQTLLLDYVRGGGTVLMQYNTTANLPSGALGPYPFRISRARVTDENAKVNFLAPEHPALNIPNVITAADFAGWVQERGLYFADEWDERFTPILASSDAGEPPLAGGLLIARHGRGHFVYTGLAFFRQLPAGVPGAYRLFANLLALSQPADRP